MLQLHNGKSTGVCWRSDNNDIFVKTNNASERERAQDTYLNFE